MNQPVKRKRIPYGMMNFIIQLLLRCLCPISAPRNKRRTV